MTPDPRPAHDDDRPAAVVRGRSAGGWAPGQGPAAPEEKPSPRLVRSAEDLDIVLGMLGFWTLVLFVATLWSELTGADALGWALGLLAAVLLMWGLIRLRRRLPSRTADGRRRG